MQLVHRSRPALVRAVEAEGLVEREIGLDVEQGNRVAQHLAVALLEAREDPESGPGVGLLDRIVELVAQRLELRDVGREQIALGAVQRLEVALVDLR